MCKTVQNKGFFNPSIHIPTVGMYFLKYMHPGIGKEAFLLCSHRITKGTMHDHLFCMLRTAYEVYDVPFSLHDVFIIHVHTTGRKISEHFVHPTKTSRVSKTSTKDTQYWTPVP